MPLGNSFSITVVWGISVMLHRGIRQSGIDSHSAKTDDHLSYAFGLRRSHLALKWKSRQRRSYFVGEHCQVHYMSISSHWKHKNSIDIDFIASNGGVATFFSRRICHNHSQHGFDRHTTRTIFFLDDMLTLNPDRYAHMPQVESALGLGGAPVKIGWQCGWPLE